MLVSVVHRSTPVSYGPYPFAGSLTGTAGSNDGTSSNASFNNPTWIVGDGSGNYYVSDTGNHTIRKVTSLAVVTTVFGTAGASGSDSTHLNSPRGIALDSSNNLYVADYSNNRVIYIANGSSTGTTLATFSNANVIQVAVDSNGSNMIILTNGNGKNIYQYRNGVYEGLINLRSYINFIYYPIQGASITYNPNGTFYFSTAPGQFNNQVGMYRMQTLQPPTTVLLNISNITQPSGAGTDVYVNFSSSATAAGFDPGQPFTFSNFASSNWTASSGSYTDLVSYNGTVKALDQSGGNNLTFRYSPSNNFPLGVPNSGGSFSNSSCNAGSSYSNLLGIGWDNFIGAQTVGNLSPEDVFRINFYFTDSSSVFPSVPESNYPTTLSGSTTTLSGFTGTFTYYNGSYSDSTYQTTVCDATAAISTFTLGVTSGSSSTQAYTNKTNYIGFTLAGYRLWGPGVPEGTTVLTDTNSGQTGTITLTNPITTTSTTYYVSSWPYGSKRVVQLVFPAIACPTGSYNRGGGRDPILPVPACKAIIISNALTGVSVNGAAYGYSIANIQFLKPESNFFYASSAYGTGIQKYSISGDTAVSVDTNSSTGSPSSFAVLTAATAEVITIVTTSNASNSIVKYANSY